MTLAETYNPLTGKEDRLTFIVGTGFSIACHVSLALYLASASLMEQSSQEEGSASMEISISLTSSLKGAEEAIDSETAEELPLEELVEEVVEVLELEPEPLAEVIEEPVEPAPVPEVVEDIPEPVAESPEKFTESKDEVTEDPVKKVEEPPASSVGSGQADVGEADNAPDQVTLTGGGPVGNAQPSYLSNLRFWLEKNKTYPKQARRRRMQGVVHLYFRVHRDGSVTEFRIVKSAGHELLDREAIAMLKRAQPLPIFPDDMIGGYLDVTVPVDFSLRGNS